MRLYANDFQKNFFQKKQQSFLPVFNKKIKNRRFLKFFYYFSKIFFTQILAILCDGPTRWTLPLASCKLSKTEWIKNP